MSPFFFSVHKEKPETRYSAIPVFLMLIGAVTFTCMSKPFFIATQYGLAVLVFVHP